jgi:transcriptional regulator with XRE-family HTH domain
VNITVNITEIQKARLKKGYSQRELARKAGVSTLAVNYMEQQKTVPRPKTLQKICSSLDLSITDICEINA